MQRNQYLPYNLDNNSDSFIDQILIYLHHILGMVEYVQIDDHQHIEQRVIIFDQL